MKSGEDKYDRVIDTLRKSVPLLAETGDIEEKVMGKIRETSGKASLSLRFFDYLFGWVYIGWIRTGLITASVVIISLFAWQQSVILKRINSLEKKAVISDSKLFSGTQDELEGKIMLYRLTGSKLPESFTISERQLNRLLRNYSELQTKYGDLLKLIEDDPVLKKYVEEKLNETNKKKFKL